MNMCAWASASRRRAPCWGASRGARGSSSWPCPLALHVRVGLGLETTGALLGCEPRCARFLFLALSSLCMCAWAWASRRQSPCWGASRGAWASRRQAPCWGAIRVPPVSSWPCPRSVFVYFGSPCARARVRGPRDGGRLGLALALFLFTLALLVHVHVCVGLETAGALVLPSLCFCFLWLPLCTCAAWAWASRGRARGASRVARGYS